MIINYEKQNDELQDLHQFSISDYLDIIPHIYIYNVSATTNNIKSSWKSFHSKLLHKKPGFILTLSQPSTTVVPYANSLDLDETLSYSAAHPDPSCLTLEQQFHQL